MTASPLTVERVQEDVVRVAPHGELDLGSAYRFDEEVRSIQDAEPGTLVVDLRDVTFVDSAGLGRLVAVAHRARVAGRRICFVRGPRTVTRVFALSGLGGAVEWVRHPDEAVAAGTLPRVAR